MNTNATDSFKKINIWIFITAFNQFRSQHQFITMRKYFLLLFVIIQCWNVQAQQKKVVDKQSNDSHVTQKISGTFKSTRVINAHSTEMLVKGSMDVRISHRFGLINQGYKQFYGLDNATMRMGFDYGVTRTLMIGIGRSTVPSWAPAKTPAPAPAMRAVVSFSASNAAALSSALVMITP